MNPNLTPHRPTLMGAVIVIVVVVLVYHFTLGRKR